jgi:glycosyltransferase involved in cell wall biosynthesis
MESVGITGSRLSLGYFSPAWPADTSCNGIATYVGTVTPVLRALGHDVTIIAANVAQGTRDETVYDLKQVQKLRNTTQRAIAALRHRIAPRATHAHMGWQSIITAIDHAHAKRRIQIFEMEETFGLARRVCQKTSIPVCVRLHGPWFLNGQAEGFPQDEIFRSRVLEERQAICAAHGITAPSRAVLKCVRDYYGLVLPSAEVIPNPTLPVPVAQRWQPDSCDPNHVLFVGRFDRHKGGDLIIEAFRLVLQEFPDVRLSFVGPDRGCVSEDGREWSLEDFVRARIPGALEAGRVKLLGRQPQSVLGEIRRGAAVSVVCSRYETFSYTALEAVTMGCPTVAADVGGIPEIVRDGVTGLLHRAGDPGDVAAKIIELLRDPSRAAWLGHRAAVECERRFHPDVIAAQLVEFYRRILGG